MRIEELFGGLLFVISGLYFTRAFNSDEKKIFNVEYAIPTDSGWDFCISDKIAFAVMILYFVLIVLIFFLYYYWAKLEHSASGWQSWYHKFGLIFIILFSIGIYNFFQIFLNNHMQKYCGLGDPISCQSYFILGCTVAIIFILVIGASCIEG